jgi:hypothetical protein
VPHLAETRAQPIELHEDVRFEELGIFSTVTVGGSRFAVPPIVGVLGDDARSLAECGALVLGRAACLQPRKLDGERVGVDARRAPPREASFHDDRAAAAERIEHETTARRQPFQEAPRGEGMESRGVAVEGMHVRARSFVRSDVERVRQRRPPRGGRLPTIDAPPTWLNEREPCRHVWAYRCTRRSGTRR